MPLVAVLIDHGELLTSASVNIMTLLSVPCCYCHALLLSLSLTLWQKHLCKARTMRSCIANNLDWRGWTETYSRFLLLSPPEIERVQKDEPEKDSETYLDLFTAKNIKLKERVLIPVKQYPKVGLGILAEYLLFFSCDCVKSLVHYAVCRTAQLFRRALSWSENHTDTATLIIVGYWTVKR